MKAFAVIANILLPGVGSFFVGKVGSGFGQLIIWSFGLAFTIGTFGLGGIVGIPMMIGAWIWAIVTASGGGQQNITVNVVQDGQQ